LDNSTRVDKNVTDVIQQNLEDTSGSLAKVITRAAQGTIMDVGARTLLEYRFRTSAYEDLKTKVQAFTNQVSGYEFINNATACWNTQFTIPFEDFDRAEIEGVRGQKPLLEFEFDIQSMQWFTEYMKPLVYREYPRANVLVFERDTSIYGYIPSRCVGFEQHGSAVASLESESISTRNTSIKVAGRFHLLMYEDYKQLKSQAARLYVEESASSKIPDPELVRIMNSNFPIFTTSRGVIYPLNILYRFPEEARPRKVASYITSF
jgi:hypothetical protein